MVNLVRRAVTAALASSPALAYARNPRGFPIGAVLPQCATPTFVPSGGSYTSTQTVTISCSTPSSTIYYTTDGSLPTTSSAVYSSPLTVSVTETINAIATAPGYLQSTVGSSTYTINAAVNANAYKFTPSYFYATYSVTPGAHLPATGSGTQLATDLAQLAAAPLPSNQIPAYAFPMTWDDLETFPGASTNQNSASQYSIANLAAVINQCQSAFPTTGCRLAIYLSFEAVISKTSASIQSTNWATSNGIVPSWVALANGTPNSFSVPTTFGQSSPVTTGVASPINGTSYYNIIFSDYNGTDYIRMMPDWRSVQVQQAAIQMMQWLAQATFTITTGPFAGTWTLDTCPCVELIGDNSEITWNFFNGGSCQPQTASGALSPTWQNLLAGLVNVQNARAALFPHTLCQSCTSYGLTGSNGSNAGYDMGALVNPNIAFSSSGVPRYSGVVPLSGSDTYAGDWDATHSFANPAKLGQTGRVSPANYGTGGQPLSTYPVTEPTMVGVRPYVGQIQPSDWDTNTKTLPSGVTTHSASMVTALMQAAQVPGATHLVISNGDGTQGSNWAWSGHPSGSTPYASYIQANLLANYTTYPLVTVLPLNLMYGPPISAAVPQSATSILVSWSALPLYGKGGTGTGASVQLYRNGVAISGATGSAQSFTSYTDHGLATGIYTYTLALVNANGTGPQGAGTIAGLMPAATNGGSSFYNLTFNFGTAPYSVAPLYSTQAKIASISGANPAVITLDSSVTGSNPFAGKSQLFLGGYGSQGQGAMNPSAPTFQSVTAQIASTGGSSGAYTITTNINGTYYGAFTAGSVAAYAYGGSYSGVNTYNTTADGMVSTAPTTNETGLLTLQVTDSAATPNVRNVVLWATVNSTLKVLGTELFTGVGQLPAAMQSNIYGTSSIGYLFTCAGGTGISQSWSVTGLPAGLSIASSTNPRIVGTPTLSGTFNNIVATVTDSGGVPQSATFKMTVAANANIASAATFRVSSGKLYDPTGAPHFMRGLNRNHIDSGSQSAFLLTGMNTMRCFLATQFYTEAQQATFITNQLLSIGVLPIVTRAFDNAGNQTSGSTQTGASTSGQAGMATIVAEWVGAYSVWGSMPIIINIANEWNGPNDATWSSTYQSAIASLRTAGYTQPIMIDASNFGQSINSLVNYSSAVFNSDSLLNTLFGFHFYGLGNSFPPGSTLANLNSIIASLVSLRASVGTVYAIAEFGTSTPNAASNPSPTIVTAGEVVTQCEANGIPHLQWAFDDHNLSTNQWTSPAWFGDTWSAGTYAQATDLTPNGMDQILNPVYGVKALAAPAAYFL